MSMSSSAGDAALGCSTLVVDHKSQDWVLTRALLTAAITNIPTLRYSELPFCMALNSHHQATGSALDAMH